jgi:magnesium chelatase family protein
MTARVHACALVGVEACLVEVEADLGAGLPTFTIVGLPDAAVRESRERVLAAVRNCGYEFPARKITINLAPAHVRKVGAGFDLPIAVALLLASGQIPSGPPLVNGLFVGELGLDGSVRAARGALAVLGMAHRRGFGPVWLSHENARDARALPHVPTSLVRTLGDLRGDAGPATDPPVARPPAASAAAAPIEPSPLDLSDVQGQSLSRRALEIAAAGGHNLLLVGPPGAGKTMLARALPGILPPLSADEAIEVTTIHSVSGRLPPGSGLIDRPPFRAPHHSISEAGMVGGGSGPVPGEASLAHRGVLFLDEFPEFKRNVLEALRQPVEEGEITIARVAGAVRFPAAFSLVAAMNPCPCGHRGDTRRGCRCGPNAVAGYWAKISGPMLDRIDLMLEVPALEASRLLGGERGEPSSAIRARVEAARATASRRRSPPRNAALTTADLDRLDPVGSATKPLLVRAVERFGLSARGVHRVRRVARTIADLAGADRVAETHLAEALQFRVPVVGGEPAPMPR